jgi:molybdenum cofactor cytidylyltransferase
MGRPKQLLPWPPAGSVPIFGSEKMGTDPLTATKPLVSAAFDAVAPSCCAMIVVLGHEAEQVRAALGDRKFVAVHVDSNAEMIHSVKAGLKAAQSLHATADVLLHPADHPEVGRETLERLLQELAGQSGRAVMPEFEGQGGHPVIIPAALVPGILDAGAEGGLRQFWLDHPDRCTRLAVDDRGVVLDLDVPDDYRVGV